MTIFWRLIPTLYLLCLVTPGYCAQQPPNDPPAAVTKPEKAVVFTPRKLRLVDFSPRSGNYLFRGNMPIANGRFAYHELINTMNQRSIEKLETPLPEDIFILDISLINKLNEKHLLNYEQRFTHSNADLIYLIHYPVYGAVSSPDNYPRSLFHIMLNLPFIGGVYSLVDKLRRWLNQERSRPIALFVHCQAGSDRTGMVIGTYQMQFLGKSFLEVIEEAENIAGRPVKSMQKKALKWIAYYLRDSKGFQSVGAID